MNAFDIGRKIEQQGWDALTPFLEQVSFRGRFTLTLKGRLSEMLQSMVGDALVNVDEHTIYGIEVKTELADKYGNFFLETWSNKGFERRKVGWMYTLHTDFLWYYFIEENRLYSIPFDRLWQWSFVDPSRNWNGGKGRIYDFPEKPQSKYEQKNKTHGRTVPISTIKQEVGYKVFEPPSPTPIVEDDFDLWSQVS